MRLFLGLATVLLFAFIDIIHGGYIVTAPNRFIPDRNESVCISLHNLESSQDVKLHIKLSSYVPYYRWATPKAENKTLQTIETTLQPASDELRKCVPMVALASETANVDRLLLEVTGEQELSGYKFNDSITISLLSSWTDNTITFVQTDKPIYKPGQTVRFRVLTLDSRLRPLTDNIDEVAVENPSGIRVEQWKDVETSKGLGDFSLGLSDEPVQGEWTILVRQGDNEERNQFTVEEYVLPKFEVKIAPPTFVTINTTDITVDICAKYTYGEPVKGTAFLTTCLKKGYYWNYRGGYGGYGGRNAEGQPCHLSMIKIEDKDGCGYVNITREEIGYDDMEEFIWGTELKFQAHVIEKGTNVRLNASNAQTSFHQHDIEVTMEGRDSFKPGIPFNGKITVKHPDQTPAADKNITVSISNFRAGEKYEKSYLSDENGEILFTLPPVMEDKKSFTISATAMEYPANRWGSGRPGSSLRVTSWFSPSGRYLQFAPQEQEFMCGSEAELELVYTTNEEEDIDMMIVTIGPGDISNFSLSSMTLMADNAVGSTDDAASNWDKSEVDNYWWYPYPVLYAQPENSTTDSPDNGNMTTDGFGPPAPVPPPSTPAPVLPSVAKFFSRSTVIVPITGSMSPSARVLVYYVAGSGEVVSDEVQLKIKPCTENMVELSFDKERGTPDEDVTMSLKASPDSLCAYGTVDKSVYLKGGDNQLSLDTISNMLENYALHEWTGVYRNNDYCDKQFPTPKPDTYPSPPPFDSNEVMIEDLDEMPESPELVEEEVILPASILNTGGDGGPPAPPPPPGRRPGDRDLEPVSEEIIVPDSNTNLGRDGVPSTNVVIEEDSDEEESDEEEESIWGRRRKRSSPPRYRGGYFGSPYSEYKDALQGFQSSGVVVMSDLMLETRPCTRPRYDYYGGGYGYEDSVDSVGMPMAFPGMARTGMPGPPGGAGIPVPPAGPGTARPFNALPTVTVREFFPETWLWNLVSTDDQGVAEVGSKLPHTITEWIGNAMCINHHDGLGVSEPASVTTFQSFFVSATLPYSAIRGEKVPIALSVFNYLDQCLPVQLRMKSSREYRVEGGSTVDTCVCGKDSTTSDFLVTLEEIGTVNLTITATIVSNSGGICDSALDVSSEFEGVRDAVIRPIIVEPEGAPREYSVSDFICSEEDAGVSNYKLDFPLPEDETLVSDSVRSYLTVVGDVMGPALSNVDDLLRMPYGCGEQNMVGFSPNVFVLQYLEGSNRDTPEVRNKAISHMKSGYQREMNYRHVDGSYSAFGPGREDGSIWLTAFVVKCFAQASPYIFVDPELQEESIDFFRDNQSPDGCFPQVGLVHSKYMQGGVGKSSSNNGALTSYVLIAMLEAGIPSNDTTVMKAAECLSTMAIKDNYTLALMTYAFSLYDAMDPVTQRLYEKLNMNAAKEPMSTHWKATPETPKSDDDTWWYRPVSADVETTAYAMLATLRMSSDDEKVEAALDIVRWLSKQRNAYGGFGSTQDTVIGLQALAEYAALVYSDGLDLSVSAMLGGENSPFASFDITDDNSLVVQEEKIPETESVNVEVSGQGCFILQGNVKYNVHTDMVNEDTFTTAVSDYRSDIGNDPCKQRKLHVCTRYNGVGKTNMAVVKVKMITGWAAEQSSLRDLQGLQGIGSRIGLKRFDVEDNNDIQFYFDTIPSRRNLCFSFEVQRLMNVKDTKPAVVTVYDYYEKELSSEAEYEIMTTFCPDEDRKGTKEDLGDVSEETFWSSDTQQRQPALSVPPWATGMLRAEGEPEPECPVCHQNTDNFDVDADICSFKKAYKMYWRANTNYELSLMADLRPNNGKTRFDKRFINYELPEGCQCITTFNAAKGDKLMFLGNWDVDVDSRETLTLDADSVVLPLTADLERAINRGTRNCD